MSADELKPCPWCGELPKIIERPNKLWSIGCEKDALCIGWECTDEDCEECKDGYVFKQEAIDRWNRRPVPAEEKLELYHHEHYFSKNSSTSGCTICGKSMKEIIQELQLKFSCAPRECPTIDEILYVLYDRDSLGTKMWEKNPKEIAKAIHELCKQKAGI